MMMMMIMLRYLCRRFLWCCPSEWCRRFGENADETNNALNRLVVVEAFAAAALRKDEEEEEEEEEEDANLDANEREEYAFIPVDASIGVCVCVYFGYESVT